MTRNANKLLESTSWDSVEEIWEDELTGTVTKSSGITTIKYTRLTSLPSYYSGQDETEAGVFIAITDTSELWEEINKALGAASKTGWESYFDDVANVIFSELVQDGDDVGAITFSGFNNQLHDGHDTAGFVHDLPWDTPADDQLQSDVFIDLDSTSADIGEDSIIPTQFIGAILHEIGHSLGLNHSTELSGGETTVKYTIMAANDGDAYWHPDMYYGLSTDSANMHTIGLQLYDIAALQTIYGRNYDTRSASTTYKQGQGFDDLVTNPFVYTIWDGAGTDTIDASALSESAQRNSFTRELHREQIQVEDIGIEISVSMQVSEAQAADWIYAAAFAAKSDAIYLAGYSGRVVLVDEMGAGVRVYDIGAVPRRIVDTGDYLYLLTDTRLYVLRDDALHAVVDTFDGGDLVVAHAGFGLLEKKRLRWFSEEGRYLGSVASRDPIRRVYGAPEGMTLETRKHRAVIRGAPGWWD